MSAEMQIEIEDCRARAVELRKRAESHPDQWIAQNLIEAADMLEGAASDAANSVDFKAWIAAGCP